MTRRTGDSDAPTCQAQCEEPPGYWHTHTCDRRSKTDRHGVLLCAQHAKMADKRPHLLDYWKRGPR